MDLIHLTEEELLRRDAHATKCAQEYADYIHQDKFYKDAKDAFLAAEKMRIREEEDVKSDAELTCRARSSKEWATFLSQQHAVLKTAGHLRIKHENAVRSYEAYRSALSARKKELERMK